MRLSVVLLIAAALGVVGGAALISLPAVGGAIIFDSLCVAYFAAQRDDGTGPAVRQVPGVRTLEDVLERARAS